MGARGPVAAPDNVRALHGNPGGRPAPRRLTAKPGAPAAPSWLSREAKAEWRRVVPELDALGVLSKIDRAVLATYCSAWSRVVEVEALLQAEGVTTTDKNGEERKHPAWQVWRESATTVAALSKELFTSPNARLRSVMPEGSDEEEGAGILD